MSKTTKIVLAAVALVASVPAFAQEAAAASGGDLGAGLKYLAAGLAVGLAVLGGASAQGRAAAAAYEGIGRNPQSADKLFTPLLIGLALIEFQTLLAFIISILLVTQ